MTTRAHTWLSMAAEQTACVADLFSSGPCLRPLVAVVSALCLPTARVVAVVVAEQVAVAA